MDLTLMTFCRKALAVQGASNLSGVVHSMSTAMTFLWERANEQGKGTDWVNHHPIAVLYAAQVAALTNVAPVASDACNYRKAYEFCLEGRGDMRYPCK